MPRTRRFRSQLRTPGRLFRASRRNVARNPLLPDGRPCPQPTLEGARLAIRALHEMNSCIGTARPGEPTGHRSQLTPRGVEIMRDARRRARAIKRRLG